jgi:hypothetical protein
MWRIGGHDRNKARAQAPSSAVNRQLQFTFDDVIDLFLRVEMLVDRGARVELVMRERHAWRSEIAASPARQAFDSRQFAGVDERVAEYHVHSEPASALIFRTPVTHCHICGRLGYAKAQSSDHQARQECPSRRNL